MNIEYYLGLDIGTDSIGYAVTDTEYNLLKNHGEPEWGTHIFEEGVTGQERRSYRTARRRTDRRKQRIGLLKEIFAKEIGKIDEGFFVRIQESRLIASDATQQKGVFVGDVLNDKTYNTRYPTIHHVIWDLMSDASAHDVRIVYLAIAWLVAHRGHFLSNISENNVENIMNPDNAYNELMDFFDEDKPWRNLNSDERAEFFKILSSGGLGISAREKAISKLLGNRNKSDKDDDKPYYNSSIVIKLMCGGEYELSKLFPQIDIKEKISLKKDDENLEALFAELDDTERELIVRMKALYDCIALVNLMHGNKYISEAKVKVYEQHRKDLYGDPEKGYIGFKKFIRKYANDRYADIFDINSSNEAGYAAYAGNMITKSKNAAKSVFYAYIKKIISSITPDESDKAFKDDILYRIADDAESPFLPKQVTGDNRLIPYQLYLLELNKILENASKYLPFLNEKDDGISVQDKIRSIFLFRIPYFVGPLNCNSNYAWLERKANGKIYPWNIDKLVDYDMSEDKFIKKMTNTCTYISGEAVLPKKSLLYEKFEVLNEINNITIEGKPISTELKQGLYNECFIVHKRVTVKKVRDYLHSKGYGDEIKGIDIDIKSSLSSHLAFKRLLETNALTESDVEAIIYRSTCTNDSTRFKKWLKKEFTNLSNDDIKCISKISCKDFGRLSKELLEGIRGKCSNTNEENTVIGFMWEHSHNLSELLLSDKFTFKNQIEQLRVDYYSQNKKLLSARLDEMYASNPVKRQIYRTLDIINDVVKVNGQPPKKVFVEMARGGEESQKGKRTLDRYSQLKDLYKKIKDNDVSELLAELESLGETDVERNSKLQSERLYLYYTQLGRCMYSGERIELSNLFSKIYDRDHIYPQSKVKDDSIINNLVLVKSDINERKNNDFPIPQSIRESMRPFWNMLFKANFISEEKFKRLTRSTPFSDDEKWGFINRQLVETRQSTKLITELLKERFPESEIIYVKAGLVSDFRNQFKMLKVREINDLHHAKDAYLNIVVGDVYHSKFTKRWFDNYATKDYSIKTETLFSHKVFANKRQIWDGSNSIEMVRNVLRRNNVHFTAYAFCRKGGFFDQMPVKNNGKNAENLFPLKNGLSVEAYGGYNKPTISFYVLAAFEYCKKKNKKEVMIVPIRLLDAVRYNRSEADALTVIEESIKRMVTDPVRNITLPLGMRKIKVKTMFEADGFRMCLSGKSGNRIIFNPMMSLVLSNDEERYVKRLSECSKKINAKGEEYKVTKEYDGISEEENLKLYRCLAGKTENRPYCLRPGIPDKGQLSAQTQAFIKLPMAEQIKTLLELITLFGRSAQTGKSINMGCGACLCDSKLSNWAKHYKDVRIIDTAPSGLFEERSMNLLELLK